MDDADADALDAAAAPEVVAILKPLVRRFVAESRGSAVVGWMCRVWAMIRRMQATTMNALTAA